MLIATDFIILRGIKADAKLSVPLERKPIRLATVIDEPRFEKMGFALLHLKTVFLEDPVHDWTWRDGRLRYYSRVADTADVIAVFAEQEVRFCITCGAQLSGGQHVCDG